MGYYEFPHTRNYDTDLGYLIKRYFELNNDFESLEKNFNDLKTWCISQLNSEALKTLVANKLDEWLEDGTLASLINNPLNHVTAYDTIVEMLTHSALLEGSKIYCSGADTINDGKGGHFRIRARLSTDVIDNNNLYLIDGGLKVAERLMNNYLYITPEQFGAKGDGITDDTEAIQNAINNNNIIAFKAGSTYLTGTISIQKDITIIGNGATIKSKSVNTSLYLYAWDKNINNVIINNLKFDGKPSDTDLTPIIRCFCGNNKTFKELVFNNCEVYNSGAHGIGLFNESSNATDFKITLNNCYIHNCNSVGIIQTKVSSIIENCVIDTTGAEAITIDNGCVKCVVKNTKINNYGHGGGIGIDESTDTIIDGCVIDGTNATAVQEYKNAITININTGTNKGLIITNNILKNNGQSAIEIGDVGTSLSNPNPTDSCIINNNMFVNNTVDIYFLYANENTRVKAIGNKYSNGNYVHTTISSELYCKCFDIDYVYNVDVVAKDNFTVSKVKCEVKNKTVNLNMIVTSNSSNIGEGWKNVVQFPFKIKNNRELTCFITDYSTVSYKDFNIVNNMMSAYWVGNESIKMIPINISFDIE